MTEVTSQETPDMMFRLESVKEAPAPQGGEGVWHRYVITQGVNTIVGMRAGMLGEVQTALQGFVQRLNARSSKQLAKTGRRA